MVNGASSGFDMMTAKALADDGHTVYASMRETERHNIPRVADVAQWSTEHSADMRTVELDLQSEPSLATAIEHIVEDAGALYVIVHNAGHMVFGPADYVFNVRSWGGRWSQSNMPMRIFRITARSR